MSSSKSLFEDVKWALSNRKLGSFKMALKKALKMHKYAKTAFIKKEGLSAFFLSRHGTISKNLRTFALGFGFVPSPRHFGKT